MSNATMQKSGEALREGVEKALSERLTVDFWHALESGDEASAFDKSLWQELEALGLTSLLNSAAKGGAQASLLEAHGALEALSRLAVPSPAAETMMANWCAERAGLRAPPGALSLAPVNPQQRLTLNRAASGYSLCGQLTGVPFARHCKAIIVQAELAGEMMLCSVPLSPTAGVTLTESHGLNGEARDTLTLDLALNREQVAPLQGADLITVGAAMRAVQMANANAAAMELSIEYVRERQQFGRPLAKFQAIQQQLAVMAAQSTAATVAARRAFIALDSADPFFAVAAAKVAVGQAASQGAAIAHQVHGAMGFTAEYGLHRFTRRLWTWREEFGNEAWWAQRLGQHVASAGADALWPMLVAEQA